MPYAAPVWNLESITQEVRAITGRPDASMMTDAQIWDFVNYYYQYVLSKELKIFWGYTYYQFYTQQNVDQYPAPSTFQTLNPVAYADGYQMDWYLSPDTFYQDYPNQYNKQTVGTGDGILNSFDFNISAFPVLPRSVYVTDGVQVSQDDGVGGFVDSVSGVTVGGTIDYATGVVDNLGFVNVPALDSSIICTSCTFFAARPVGILFYPTQRLTNSTTTVRDSLNMFVLRPVPDQCYLIKMEGIQIPRPLLSNSDVPFRPDLGPLIALGAAMHIFKRFNQMDQYAQYLPEYNRYKDVSMQDTYEEYLYQRSVPKF